MAREWKFRVRDAECNSMFYSDNPRDVFPLDPDEGFDGIMQYTGLKDKNGKEAYEGDIIRYIDNGDIGEVIYHTDTASFNAAIISQDGILRTLWKDFEVIGNIYENKDLLNESL